VGIERPYSFGVADPTGPFRGLSSGGFCPYCRMDDLEDIEEEEEE